MEEKEEKKSSSKQIQLSSETLYILFAFIALALVVVVKILGFFGVYSGVLNAILFIIACGLTATAMILSYLSEKTLKVEFWLNLAVLVIALLLLN